MNQSRLVTTVQRHLRLSGEDITVAFAVRFSVGNALLSDRFRLIKDAAITARQDRTSIYPFRLGFRTPSL